MEEDEEQKLNLLKPNYIKFRISRKEGAPLMPMKIRKSPKAQKEKLP